MTYAVKKLARITARRGKDDQLTTATESALQELGELFTTDLD